MACLKVGAENCYKIGLLLSKAAANLYAGPEINDGTGDIVRPSDLVAYDAELSEWRKGFAYRLASAAGEADTILASCVQGWAYFCDIR
jgi:hypothetical protein